MELRKLCREDWRTQAGTHAAVVTDAPPGLQDSAVP
jgi:hypothetical protein